MEICAAKVLDYEHLRGGMQKEVELDSALESDSDQSYHPFTITFHSLLWRSIHAITEYILAPPTLHINHRAGLQTTALSIGIVFSSYFDAQ